MRKALCYRRAMRYRPQYPSAQTLSDSQGAFRWWIFACTPARKWSCFRAERVCRCGGGTLNQRINTLILAVYGSDYGIGKPFCGDQGAQQYREYPSNSPSLQHIIMTVWPIWKEAFSHAKDNKYIERKILLTLEKSWPICWSSRQLAHQYIRKLDWARPLWRAGIIVWRSRRNELIILRLYPTRIDRLRR